MRHSELQKSVLSLYRSLLREIRRKPVENQSRFQEYIKSTFRRDASRLAVKDIDAIEYFVRKGGKQLESLKNPSITNIS